MEYETEVGERAKIGVSLVPSPGCPGLLPNTSLSGEPLVDRVSLDGIDEHDARLLADGGRYDVLEKYVRLDSSAVGNYLIQDGTSASVKIPGPHGLEPVAISSFVELAPIDRSPFPPC